jgi:hypothetical protein
MEWLMHCSQKKTYERPLHLERLHLHLLHRFLLEPLLVLIGLVLCARKPQCASEGAKRAGVNVKCGCEVRGEMLGDVWGGRPHV